MNKVLKKKVIKALKRNALTPAQLTRVLAFKNEKSLEKLMETINQLYWYGYVIPVYSDGEKTLVLRKEK